MNILQLYRDYSISYQTEDHKHCRPGWVNTSCPFCTGNPGLHLGATIEGGHFYCWRCGWKPASLAISKLLNISEHKAKSILRDYIHAFEPAPDPKIRLGTKAFRMPSDISPLLKQHQRYLIKRNFDPEKLEREWGLLGTGPASRLDHINYGHRILAPIHWQGKQVTFQARDISNRHPMKYLACPKHRELIHHKHLLYGREKEWGEVGICVEGITDVWRLGPAAFCVFGIEYTQKQVRIMAKQFQRIAVIFDQETQAQIQAERLVSELGFRGVSAVNIQISGDPGELGDDDARHLVKSII